MAETKRLRRHEQAVEAAQRGETDEALAFLLTRPRDFAACASAIQLLAFRDEWRALVPLAMTVIATEPEAHASREACLGACDLLHRASQELHDENIVAAAEANVVPSMRGEARPRLRGGVEPPKVPTQEDRERFEAHAKEAATARRFRGKPGARAAHQMAYAHLHLGLEEEVIALWNVDYPELRFREATWVARALARRGDGEQAWEVLVSRLSSWWPSTIWDVAPIELLVEPLLAPLMTPERRALVLVTPRGEGYLRE